MTVPPGTDAPINLPRVWKALPWIALQQQVRRLQVRIAKAIRLGKYRRASALQWLLTHSRAARLLAVKRVTTNRGARTPGIDNVRWRTDRQKLQAADNLKRHGYKPKPLRRIYIPKKNGKLRPLSIPTLHDRAMQALYALALAPVAETMADPYSYGFREGRSCADALEHAHIVLSHKHSAQWVLEGDIKACFDEISHTWLLQNIPMDKQVLRKWLGAGYWEKATLYPTDKGTPQGGIISPILANLVLDGMQKAIAKACQKGDKVNFMRYADDFIATGATEQILEQKVKPALTVFLAPRGLELSEQKTVITHLSKGFNFLGHTLRRFGDKLLTTPAKSNVKAFREKVRLCIQSARGQSQEKLLRKLNPIIRGWANYYRHGAAKRTFDRLDHDIYWQLWRWAKRRHPNKPAKWLRRKYYTATGKPGHFSVRLLTKDKDTRHVLALYRAASTKIQRHVKIQGAANPYDSHYDEYFERRRRLRRWRQRCGAGNALAPPNPPLTRIVKHWLEPAAACSHPNAPV